MNRTIKDRIEQINKGRVPKGYKKTNAGIIPSEWETPTLGQLLEFKNGVNADKEKYNSGIKMISVMDILKDTPIFYDNIIGQVDIDEKALENYRVTYGDILFQRSSETFEDAGRSNVYLDENKTATYSGFVIRGKKKAEYNPYFLNEVLKNSSVRYQIIRNAAGSQHINIGQDSLVNIEVYLASKDEQAKIAKILTVWDEVIGLQRDYINLISLKFENLINKVIFSLDCGFKPLYDCVNYYQSDLLVKNLKLCGNGYPVYGANGVATFINSYNFDCSAISIIKYGSGVGRVGLLHGKHSVLGTMAEMIAKENICINYIYYAMKTISFKKYVEISTTPNLYFEDYSKEKVKLPPYEEQVKVANKLETMESLIIANKKKLECLEIQRKALQQHLLAGIVRV